ncbi:hypothetical protein D3C72_1988390 [compost metagenome]
MSSRNTSPRRDSRISLDSAPNISSVCRLTSSTRISCMQRETKSGCTLRKVRKSVMPAARTSSSSILTALKSSTHSDTGECSNRPTAYCSLRRNSRSVRTRAVMSSIDSSTRSQLPSWPGITVASRRMSRRSPSSV